MFYDQVKESADYIQSQLGQKVDVSVILGSGLGKIVDAMTEKRSFPISRFPTSPKAP